MIPSMCVCARVHEELGSGCGCGDIAFSEVVVVVLGVCVLGGFAFDNCC